MSKDIAWIVKENKTAIKTYVIISFLRCIFKGRDNAIAIGNAPFNPPKTKKRLYRLFKVNPFENILNLFFIKLTRGEMI